MKIQIHNLTKIYQENSQYPVRALDRISFTVNQGEIIGIIGTSGSGKSSLFRCITGVLNPTSGNVNKELVNGESIGLIMQEPELQFFLETIFEEVAFGIRHQGLSETQIKERVLAALTKVDFNGDYQKSPFRLSGGEKRRVALASIIIMEPTLLLMDEPTAGLDQPGLKTVSRLIDSYRELNKSVIIISHDLDFLYEKVDRFLLLNEGLLVADFKKTDIFKQIDHLISSGVGLPEKVALWKKNPPHFVKEWL